MELPQNAKLGGGGCIVGESNDGSTTVKVCERQPHEAKAAFHRRRGSFHSVLLEKCSRAVKNTRKSTNTRRIRVFFSAALPFFF